MYSELRVIYPHDLPARVYPAALLFVALQIVFSGLTSPKKLAGIERVHHFEHKVRSHGGTRMLCSALLRRFTLPMD